MQTGRANNPLDDFRKNSRSSPRVKIIRGPEKAGERIYLHCIKINQRKEATRSLSELRLNVLIPGPEREEERIGVRGEIVMIMCEINM